jgi:hypothetical protein
MTNTASLIDRLVDEGPRSKGGHTQRFALPLLAAFGLCIMGVALTLDGAFATLESEGIGSIGVKWGFSLALLGLGAAALWVLGKPGRPTRQAVYALAIPFIPIVVLLALELTIAGPLPFGETWRECLAAMLVMSPIAFAGAVLAMRALAPTDLRRAGLAAGLFGGAVAMTAYTPYCPERGILYMVEFYCLPIMAMAAFGWAAGPRLLRW